VISTRRGGRRAEEKAAQERRCLAEKEAQERRCLAEKEAQEKTLSFWRGGKKKKKRELLKKDEEGGCLGAEKIGGRAQGRLRRSGFSFCRKWVVVMS
jgi:hypothetical protein